IASTPRVMAKPAPAASERPTVTAIVEMEGASPISPPLPSPSGGEGKLGGPLSQSPTVIHPKEPASMSGRGTEVAKLPAAAGTLMSSGTVVPADSEAAQKLRMVKGHRGWVMAVAFSPDRNTLASGGLDGSVRLRSFSKARPKE